MDGGWSSWSPWSVCNQPCLGGDRQRIRDCSNSTPRYGGLDCEGNDTEIIVCATRSCKCKIVNLVLLND